MFFCQVTHFIVAVAGDLYSALPSLGLQLYICRSVTTHLLVLPCQPSHRQQTVWANITYFLIIHQDANRRCFRSILERSRCIASNFVCLLHSHRSSWAAQNLGAYHAHHADGARLAFVFARPLLSITLKPGRKKGAILSNFLSFLLFFLT